MKCDECEHWITTRETHYEDGSTVVNYRCPDGKGRCNILGIDTDPDFGCNKFSGGTLRAVISYKSGAPWQHHVMGACPDCEGLGSQTGSACMRCAGTAKVRYYDDGHIGEERTRLHPDEKKLHDQRLPYGPNIADGTALKDLRYRERDRDMKVEPL